MFDLSSINNTPWMIDPTQGGEMVRMLPQLLRGGVPSQAELSAHQEAAMQRMHTVMEAVKDSPESQDEAEASTGPEAAAKRIPKIKGKLAIIRVRGVVEHRMSMWSYYYGGFSTEMGGRVLDDYLARKDIDAILLDIDSPGGSVYGVEEFADKIFQGRAKKPIYALANAGAYSAAFWIGAAAADLGVTPSGGVGSLGVYILHMEYTKMMEEVGIKAEFVRKPAFKAEANPYEALSEEARQHLQEIVDGTYDKFESAVAKYRGTQRSDVKKNFGQGRIVMAQPALDAKMVDRVISMDEILMKILGSTDTQPSTSRASVQQQRMRSENAKRSIVKPVKRKHMKAQALASRSKKEN